MGVSLNMAFDDGSVVALWKITESEGKSLSEQRLAVDALIDKVFEGKYRLCHDGDGIPALEGNTSSVPFVSVSHTKGWVAVMSHPKERVGIDIELSGRDFSAVGKKAISDIELEQIDGWAETLKNSLPRDADANPSETASALNARNTILGLIWCAKEAVYKRLTVPATDFAKQIEIENIIPTSPQKGKIVAEFKYDNGGIGIIHLSYTLHPSLILVHTID